MRETYDVKKVRSFLSDMIADLQEIADERPVHGAELTLAIKYLQHARIQLGVAQTILKGENP
ncbi:MAG: hypothetical protein U9O78_04035 [Patescibacteria group bacterium]|nr:hypothetical protein [Patescibacteria group bacterium]